MSIEHEKEFIDIFMFMPMIFALDHRQPDDRVVHLAERRVIPLVGDGIGYFLHIDNPERGAQNVEVSLVWKILLSFVWIHDCNLDIRQPSILGLSYTPLSTV